jgi:hypothetical protein
MTPTRRKKSSCRILDDTAGLEPQAHIWTRSKARWITFKPGTRAFEENPPAL